MAAEAGAHAGKARSVPSWSRMVALGRLPAQAARRLGWGVADQAVSSLTNFAVSIYVVRELGAVQFGAFSLAYVTYAFALTASRGLATDPLLVRVSATDLDTWRRAVANCTGTAAAVGLATGAGVLVASLVLHGSAQGAFLALGLTLPGLLLQDSWRYSFFALGNGKPAFLNDTIWALTLLPALVLVRSSGHADVFWFVLAWGGSATVAAAAGPFQAGVAPTLARAWTWLSRHRDLGARYFAEGTTWSVVSQLRTYGIGLILGLAALGYVQAANTLMGPLTILWLGMSMVAIPEAARILRNSPLRLPLFCLLLSGALTVAALTWGVVVLVALPKGLGAAVLGPVWRHTYPLVLLQALFVTAQIVSLRKAGLPLPSAKNEYRQLSCSSSPGRVSPSARKAPFAEPWITTAAASTPAPVVRPTAAAVPVQRATARRHVRRSVPLTLTSSGSVARPRDAVRANV